MHPNHTPERKRCSVCGTDFVPSPGCLATCSTACQYTSRRRKNSEPGPNPGGLCMCGCGERTTIAKRSDRQHGWVAGTPQRYVSGHNRNVIPGPRLSEVDNGFGSPCWIWCGAVDKLGYGRTMTCRNGKNVPALAHRVYYEQRFGGIPPNMDLHHRCETPACCNPDHLEPLTRTEHVRKGRGIKLSLSAARRIRSLYPAMSQSAIAREYGVNPQTIRAVLLNRTWVEDNHG
jgi:hypothetical protein